MASTSSIPKRRARLSNPPLFRLAQREGARITLKSDTTACAHVFVLEHDLVRLLVLPSGDIEGPASWSIAPGQSDVPDAGRDRMSTDGFTCPDFVLEQDDGKMRIETERMRLEVQFDGLCCCWFHRVGNDWVEIARDRATQAYNFGWWDASVQHFVARTGQQKFFGLGEKSGPLDRAGRRVRSISLDPMGYDAETSDPLYKTLPYLLVADETGACHGTFYDNMGEATIDLGCELDNYHGHFRSFVATSGDLDLYMIAGPDPREVTKRFTWLTGRPARMPRWALGYSGSTMTYTDASDAQEQMQQFIDRLEEHDIGCSSFHLSSGYTSIGEKRYVFNWNRDKFPAPAEFVKSFRAAGIELVPNIKPALLRDHPQYAVLASQCFFVSDDDGEPIEVQFWDELGALIDFTNPAAAAWWREQVTTALLDYGIRSTWNDNNEFGVWDPAARFAFSGQPRLAHEARGLQPLLMMRASRQAQLAEFPQRTPYVVTRSGMTGMHRYAQTWTGDNRTEWKTIRYNAKMGIGLAISGISNCGHDVGGFAGPAPDPELFVRWVQAGILMPRFSIHSWNDDATVNEPWMYPEVLPAIARLLRLRQRIEPFLADLLWRYHQEFEPVICPPWFEFGMDERAWTDGDEHMLGRNVLVALVCDTECSEREVYLPVGCDWVEIATGQTFSGGTLATLGASLDAPPPMLARAGSAMPVNLAEGGFRPASPRRGLWLFPLAGEGRFDWSFFEEGPSETGPMVCWSGSCVSQTDKILLTIAVDGPVAASDREITVLLPHGDDRVITTSGLPSDPREIEGRRGVVISL